MIHWLLHLYKISDINDHFQNSLTSHFAFLYNLKLFGNAPKEHLQIKDQYHT